MLAAPVENTEERHISESKPSLPSFQEMNFHLTNPISPTANALLGAMFGKSSVTTPRDRVAELTVPAFTQTRRGSHGLISPLTPGNGMAGAYQPGDSQTNTPRWNTPERRESIISRSSVQPKLNATRQQLKVLMTLFDKDPRPSAGTQELVAHSIGMSKKQVRNWFQNQRAKLRRLERETAHAVAVAAKFDGV